MWELGTLTIAYFSHEWTQPEPEQQSLLNLLAKVLVWQKTLMLMSHVRLFFVLYVKSRNVILLVGSI